MLKYYGLAAHYPGVTRAAIFYGGPCVRCGDNVMRYRKSGECIRCAARIAEKVFILVTGAALMNPDDVDNGRIVAILDRLGQPVPWTEKADYMRALVRREPCRKCGGIVGRECYDCGRRFYPVQPREEAIFNGEVIYRPQNACRKCETKAPRLTATGECLGCP